jgi:trehalose-phosphatase
MPESDVARVAGAVRELAASRHLLLLLDFDGTLCEFDPDPAAVWLPEARRDLLLAIDRAGGTTLGIVSGRRLDDVRQRTRLPATTYYAGLHGLEIEGRGGYFVHPDAAATSDLMARLREALDLDLRGMPGVFIENKALSIAAHYRSASEADAKRVPDVVMRHAGSYLEGGTLRIMRGACMMELLPLVRWNKGNAVDWIRGRVEAHHGNVGCVYVGDDVTDEDAFRAVRGHGLSVAASRRAAGADFVIQGPAEVQRLLELLPWHGGPAEPGGHESG